MHYQQRSERRCLPAWSRIKNSANPRDGDWFNRQPLGQLIPFPPAWASPEQPASHSDMAKNHLLISEASGTHYFAALQPRPSEASNKLHRCLPTTAWEQRTCYFFRGMRSLSWKSRHTTQMAKQRPNFQDGCDQSNVKAVSPVRLCRGPVGAL